MKRDVGRRPKYVSAPNSKRGFAPRSKQSCVLKKKCGKRHSREETVDHDREALMKWLQGEDSEFQPVSVPEASSETSAGSARILVAALPRCRNSPRSKLTMLFTESPKPSMIRRLTFGMRPLKLCTIFRKTTRRRSRGPCVIRPPSAARESARRSHRRDLADQAIGNLTGESRDKTYDAFSLLFLMSKSGELNPLMRAIEAHPSTEVRVAVVKLLALSGQPEVLPAFRRMAVRGSLPPDVRSAVMEAIYQVTSQSPGDDQPPA